MQSWSLRRAILVGGSVAGVLDILFAITFAYTNGAPPQRLLQTVASGLLGQPAYEGGWPAAMLGLTAHFLMSYAYAAVYVLASRRFELLRRNPVLAGAVFGALVLLFMRLVVLPLSAFPHPVSFKPLATTLDLMSHMFLFGVPIALAARKAVSMPEVQSTDQAKQRASAS
jgi:uncharacterized membrane protein YagU involved in acid resistance